MASMRNYLMWCWSQGHLSRSGYDKESSVLPRALPTAQQCSQLLLLCRQSGWKLFKVNFVWTLRTSIKSIALNEFSTNKVKEILEIVEEQNVASNKIVVSDQWVFIRIGLSHWAMVGNNCWVSVRSVGHLLVSAKLNCVSMKIFLTGQHFLEVVKRLVGERLNMNMKYRLKGENWLQILRSLLKSLKLVLWPRISSDGSCRLLWQDSRSLQHFNPN